MSQGKFLGRFQSGDEVDVPLMTRNALGRPVAPDAAPHLTVFDSSGATLYAGSGAARDRAAATGLFYAKVFLTDDFEAGQYSCLWRWLDTSGAHHGGLLHTFRVLPGGDGSGQVVAMHEYNRPAARHLVQQRSSGTLWKGRNPRRSR
jgi:hypothetical protein